MAKRRGQGKHPKRKGPGGPVRPISAAPSRRVAGGGRPASGRDDPTEELVDALMESFGAGPEAVDPVQVALFSELDATHLVPTLLRERGSHIGPMLAAAANGLAARETAQTDRALAALAYVHRASGRSKLAAFSRAWQRRRPQSPDVIAQGIGDDEIIEVVEIGHVTGDGVNLILVMDGALGPYTVALYVDHNLGGLAKDVIAGPPYEDVRALYVRSEGFTARTIPVAEAAWRIDEAVELTRRTIEPPVSEDFDDLLPLVEHRLRGVQRAEPSTMVDPDGTPFGWVDVSRAERLAHLGAFRTSPEFDSIPADVADDAFEAVDLFLDHAVGYTIGRARRVSPVLVELFCVSWFPRKVVADRALIEAAPVGIEAWLRFCARTTGLDDRWLAEALESLEQFAPYLSGALDDPGSWGLGKSLLSGVPIGSGAGDRSGPSGPFDEFVIEGTETSTTSWVLPNDLVWQRPEPSAEGQHIRTEVDPSGVPHWQRQKTKLIASQASVQAAALLGPSFAQPAMELAVALGSTMPCPYDGSQWTGWPGAIIWLLAEDSNVFSTRSIGQRRDDLAEALPLTRATYQAKAKKIRDALGLPEGATAVAW